MLERLSKLSNRNPVRRGVAMRASRIAGCAALLLMGACSVPDWADPSSYFEPDYGPAPKPVARTGGEALPESSPAPQLASATENIQRSGEKPVIAVTQGSAATPTAATPPLQPLKPAQTPRPARVATETPPLIDARRDTAAKSIRTPSPSTPAKPTATTVASTEAQPVVQRSAVVSREPSPPPATAPKSASSRIASKPRPAERVAPARATESPTPMIAAMTQGQRPPSFSKQGAVVPRRTDVRAEDEIDKVAARATSGRETGKESASGGRSSAAATQTAARTTVQPALSRTYEEQLRAAGIEPANTAPAQSGRVQPGTFPSRVPAVVQQTYQESLNAPRTYSEVVGGYSSGGSAGPVVISGGGAVQQAAFAGGTATGSADTVILFRHGSTSISSADLARLKQTATRALQTNARVRVRGHSSSRTGQMPVDQHLVANLKMSARRAESVADALARFGVPYERIFVEAKGDNEPVYNEAMPRGEAGNRRAEVFLEN